jgi:hypothetical protein
MRRAVSFMVFFMVSSLWVPGCLILGTVAEGVPLIKQSAQGLLRLGYCLGVPIGARRVEARLGCANECLKSFDLFHQGSLGGWAHCAPLSFIRT